jgi:hypothetical protein
MNPSPMFWASVATGGATAFCAGWVMAHHPRTTAGAASQTALFVWFVFLTVALIYQAVRTLFAGV